jgi:hypothetical protein
MGRRRQFAAAWRVEHPDGHVVAKGGYETRTRRRRRELCTPPLGEPHRFSAAIDVRGHVEQG